MIEFKKIALTQFRNYRHSDFLFSERIVGICGSNGSGKTNLLDAIHYLCFSKSYFSKPDAQSSFKDLKGFRIDGSLLKNLEVQKVVCILRETNRKELSLNDEPYKKLSAHIGKFPCVFIAPDDVELITAGSETRRNFIDTILSQFDAGYLQSLIDYKKILDERNSLLKAAAEKNYLDQTLLDILDNQLTNAGEPVYHARKKFLEEFIPLVLAEYKHIASSDDNIKLNYYSQLNTASFPELLVQCRQKDLYLERTNCGIHKDDLEMYMGESSLKNMASQGQRKSILFALKLAEYAVLKKKKGYAPLLLLDDIFEKLDADRMNNLLCKVCLENDGQVFITDTHCERLKDAFEKLGVRFQLIELLAAN